MKRKLTLLSLVAALILTACSNHKETVKETVGETKVETNAETKVETKGETKTETQVETKVEETHSEKDDTHNDNNSATTDGLNIKHEGNKTVAHFHNYTHFEEFTNNNEGEFIYNPNGDFVLVEVRVKDPNNTHRVVSKIIGKLKLSNNQLLENKVIDTCGGNCPVETVSNISNDRMIEICNEVVDLLK